jgi:DNA repair photolyase
MDNSLPLFGEKPEQEWHLPDDRPQNLRSAAIEYIDSSSILTRASGFMGAYDYTLNPYSGCEFGCNYCYAAFFSRDLEKQNNWGHWVTVKQNALKKLKRMRTDLHGKKIYMSSVTDPYQGIEAKISLVRALLEYLVPKQPRLVVQTRSPLVKRDIDLYSQLEHVQVNMTITTDSEEIRKAYEPNCPKIEQRLRGIQAVAEAGINCGITMTPLLPIQNSELFATRLIETGVRNFVVQPFHANRGHFVAGTRDIAIEASKKLNWTDDKYNEVVAVLKQKLPNLKEGKEGFSPI